MGHTLMILTLSEECNKRISYHPLDKSIGSFVDLAITGFRLLKDISESNSSDQ